MVLYVYGEVLLGRPSRPLCQWHVRGDVEAGVAAVIVAASESLRATPVSSAHGDGEAHIAELDRRVLRDQVVVALPQTLHERQVLLARVVVLGWSVGLWSLRSLGSDSHLLDYVPLSLLPVGIGFVRLAL